MRYESSPTGQIKDAPTRQMLDKLQRFAQSVAGDTGFATKADLADLLAKIRANAALAQRTTTKIITPETTAPASGDFVLKSGDTMSGHLGITIRNKVHNGTYEALGIANIGAVTHDQMERWAVGWDYLIGDRVAEGGVIWESIQGTTGTPNTGNDPTATIGYWEQVCLQASPFVLETWSNAVAYDLPTYPIGSQVLYSGKAYASITAVLTNTNRQPDISPLYWTPIEFHCPIGPSYSIGDKVAWGIGLYTSLTNSNQGNVPHDNPSDWSVEVPVTVGIQYNGFGTNGNGIGVTFGGAAEAWNGAYPTASTLGVPTRADRRLIGFEPSVINRNPTSQGAKVSLDMTFKNRADTEYETAMPLGFDPLTGLRTIDRYNVHARAAQFSAFPRSSTGEYCGWPTLLKINENSTDISADQPFTVVVDMYDQSTDNDGQDTWWWWWASGLGPLPATQPKGWEAGIRYIQAGTKIEFHGNIVDGSQMACSIDMSLVNDGNTVGEGMVLNSGEFPMRIIPRDSMDLLSVGQRSGTNFITAGAAAALANPFTGGVNTFPIGFFSIWIDGNHKKLAYYNP